MAGPAGGQQLGRRRLELPGFGEEFRVYGLILQALIITYTILRALLQALIITYTILGAP